MAKKSSESKPAKTKKPKKEYWFLEEPMNKIQIMEWWIFAGATVGLLAGVLVGRVAPLFVMGSVIGFVASLIHRAFFGQKS